MNRLSTDKRTQILRCLIEGNSIRSSARISGTVKNTVLKFLPDIGNACTEYQYNAFRNLPCKRLQCDEIWSFCYSKQKNIPQKCKGIFGFGDVWTWTAICADTKIVPSWLIGDRSLQTAHIFMNDLASRLRNRVQLTTDGHKVYIEAVEEAFGCEIDYAMLIKVYGADPETEKRYSPADILETKKRRIMGFPDVNHVSTSYAERQNLNMRMSMRRFTRLTNAFSKKVENLAHAVALHFMYYNFARIHQTLRVSPAMEIGVADHLWSLEEIVGLVK